jgi:hypothetical protein
MMLKQQPNLLLLKEDGDFIIYEDMSYKIITNESKDPNKIECYKNYENWYDINLNRKEKPIIIKRQ